MTKISSHALRTGKSAFFSCLLLASVAFAQKPAAKQPDDPDYTAKIKEYLTDPRFSTELVDHNDDNQLGAGVIGGPESSACDG